MVVRSEAKVWGAKREFQRLKLQDLDTKTVELYRNYGQQGKASEGLDT